MKPKSLLPQFRIVAAATLVAASSAHADTQTWVGNSSTDWNLGANWSPTDIPATGDSFIFGTAGLGTALNNNLAAGFNVAGITFNSVASAYTVTGSSFNLTGDITNSSTSLQTFNNALTLSAATHTITTTTGGGNITLGPGSINAATGSLIIAGTGTTTLTAPADANWTLPSATSVSSGATLKLQLQSGTTAARNNNIGTITLAATNSVLELAATSTIVDQTPINGGAASSILGSGIINKTGGGYLPIWNNSTDSSFSGQINVVAGVLGVNSSSGWSNAKLNVASGAAFDVRNGPSNSVGELAGGGRVGTTFSGAKILTVGALNTDSAFSGVIENTLTPTGFTLTNITTGGTLGLTKTGTGMLTLSGTNTYTGATTVSNGALIINGNISTSVTTVTGGTLGGTGTTGALAVNSGGTFAPGDGGIESLNTGTLTLAGSSLFEINTAGDAADLAISSGLLTFGGTLTVTQLGGALQNGDVFNLFDWNTKAGTFSAVTLPTLGGGLTWDQSSLYTNGTIGVVPEPAAALLGSLGLLALLRRRRA